MSELKFNPEHPQDYWMSIDVGDVHSEYGKTAMRLSGTGEIDVEHSRIGGKKKSHKPFEKHGKLEYHEPEKLFRQVEQVPWTTKFPPRPGIPDEAIVVWKFGKVDGATQEAKMWLRDAEKNPVVGQLLKGLRQELETLTRNKIFL